MDIRDGENGKIYLPVKRQAQGSVQIRNFMVYYYFHSNTERGCLCVVRDVDLIQVGFFIIFYHAIQFFVRNVEFSMVNQGFGQ